MKLTKKAREKLESKEAKDQLAREIGKGYETIKRWIYSENYRFDNYNGVRGLKKITGLTKKELFEE